MSEQTAGRVITLDAPARESGRQLAARRGWACAELGSLDEVASAVQPGEAVIVIALIGERAPEAWVDCVEALAHARPDSPLGFVVAREPGQLCARVERIGSQPAAPGSEAPLSFVSRDLPFHVATRRCETLPKGNEGVVRLRERSPDLLVLAGHSNGHDLGADGIAWCTRREQLDPDAHPHRSPCHYGASCRFAGRGLEPSDVALIRARRIVQLACWGVSITSHPFALEASIGEALLSSSALEAMLTTLRTAQVSVDDLGDLLLACELGLPFGLIASRVNAARRRRGLDPEFVCFGDPLSSMQASAVELEVSRSDSEVNARLPAGSLAHVRVPLGSLATGSEAWTHAGSRRVVFGRELERGTLELVVEAGRAEQVTLRPAEQPAAQEASLRGLGDELEQLQRLLVGLARRGPDALIDAAREATERVRARLWGWPLGRLSAGSVLPRAALVQPWLALIDELEQLGRAWQRLFAARTRRGGINFMKAAAGLEFGAALTRAEQPCGHCGHSWRMRATGPAFAEPRRVTAHCVACGPVLEAPVGMEPPWIGVRTRGSSRELELEQRVTNPYPFPVSAAATTVLKAFESKDALAVESVRVRVEPGESVCLRAHLNVPPRYPPGVHYLDAMVCVGGRVAFVRRPWMLGAVEGSETREREA